MTDRIDVLRQSLYELCKYDEEEFLRYNERLWANIQNLGIGAVENAIKTLTKANND